MPVGEIHAVLQVHVDGSIGERRTAPGIYKQILDGGTQFTRIPLPLLALYACPHRLTPAPGEDARALAARVELDRESCEPQARALEQAIPDARVVMLPDTIHTIFLVRPREVATELEAFVDRLPE